MKTIIGELFESHGNPNWVPTKIKKQFESIRSDFTCTISDYEPNTTEWREISLSNPSSFIDSIEEVKPYAESSDIYYRRAKKSNKTKAFYKASATSVTRGCSKINDLININTVGQVKKSTSIDDLIDQLSSSINQDTIDHEIKVTKLRLKVLELFKNNEA